METALLGCKKPAEQTVVSQPAEQREAKLPNGSQVILNAQSVLSFSASTWKEHPEVILNGEAYFKTKKNTRFYVKAGQGEVELINAQANVYARGQTLEVKCTSGRVQVTNPKGTERVLLASREQVSIEDGKMQRRQGLNFYPNWFKGESAFQDAPLARVLEEIGRQYDKVVLTDNNIDGFYSGRFGHKNLEKTLSSVCTKANLIYRIHGDTVRISPE
jgi:ferric-dicitrate binding protein FerR (iron transport regulator)